MYRYLILAATLVGTAGLAHAQQAETTAAMPALTEAEDDNLMVKNFNISAAQLEDLDIRGPNGEEIGEVDEALITPEGEIVAVSAEIGGFLGIGEKDVIIQLDQLSYQDGALTTEMTKDQLENLQEWDD